MYLLREANFKKEEEEKGEGNGTLKGKALCKLCPRYGLAFTAQWRSRFSC
eukprot:c45886_g1_i1 orf=52-201(+)